MKPFKVIASFILSFAILFSIYVAPHAYQVSDMTYLYIDKGSIVIGDESVSAYGEFGQKITEYNPNGYCITLTPQATQENMYNTISFTGGSNTVVLKDVKSIIRDQFTCAMSLENNSNVTLYLEGENTLSSGSSRAGIEVSVDSTITIGGDGYLLAKSSGQAGIGGGNGRSNGTVIINSGVIEAQSKYNSAGIGGGSNGDGGNITINGGNVTAVGGDYAAGIGGGCACDGGNITINGGTVTAKGGLNSAGIGGGWFGDSGDIRINGASVIAVGNSAANIGAGVGGSAYSGPLDSSGSNVYPVTIDASSLGNISQIYNNGESINIFGAHKDYTSFCVYVPSSQSIFLVKPEASTAVFFKADVSNSAVIAQSIAPYTLSDGVSIDADECISGLRCSLSSLDGYLDTVNGFSFRYNSSVLGTGKSVELLYNETAIYSYKILIYGDLNSDSMYDAQDAFIVQLMLYEMLNSTNTDPIYFKAADVNKNGEVDVDDMMLLQQAGLMLAQIQQNEQTGELNYDSYYSFIDQTSDVEADISSQTDSNFFTDLVLKLVKMLKAFAEWLTVFLQNDVFYQFLG